MNWNTILQFLQEKAATVGLQIVGALVLYIIGRWLIAAVVGAVERVLRRQDIEATVLRFIGNTLSVALHITLVVAILGYFGVQTTTFAALIAACGLAVGTAWAGLLANFAAGAFLLVLRPFKVGDFISAGGTTGTVQEIGLFVTTFDTPDNVRTFVGNNKIFSDTIQNFSTNPHRRVELTAQISGAADPHLAISRLKARLATIPNVAKDPAPDVTILTFSPFGPVLAVRPYCSNDHYWQVYFDANMAIRETLGDAAFPGPAYPLTVSDRKAAAVAQS
ncbi:MAG TPA: mechanosensitive ion channel family protein [Bryobacteraceae bacterium]|nr:mechanosensitive ion channel family protein [Bryobacteraceae bacterium]